MRPCFLNSILINDKLRKEDFTINFPLNIPLSCHETALAKLFFLPYGSKPEIQSLISHRKAIEREWEVNTNIQISSGSVHWPPSECLMFQRDPWGSRFPHFPWPMSAYKCVCAPILVCVGVGWVLLNLMRKEDAWLKGTFLPDKQVTVKVTDSDGDRAEVSWLNRVLWLALLFQLRPCERFRVYSLSSLLPPGPRHDSTRSWLTWSSARGLSYPLTS